MGSGALGSCCPGLVLTPTGGPSAKEGWVTPKQAGISFGATWVPLAKPSWAAVGDGRYGTDSGEGHRAGPGRGGPRPVQLALCKGTIRRRP